LGEAEGRRRDKKVFEESKSGLCRTLCSQCFKCAPQTSLAMTILFTTTGGTYDTTSTTTASDRRRALHSFLIVGAPLAVIALSLGFIRTRGEVIKNLKHQKQLLSSALPSSALDRVIELGDWYIALARWR